MATAVPRIAVIGGGLSGTLCSLVLHHRGLAPVVWDQGRNLGGRLSAGGAQLLRAADPRLQAVYENMATAGLLQRYQGRTGVLGTRGGGFLSSTHIPKMRPNNNHDSMAAVDNGNDNNPSTIDRSRATDGGDFCHFIEGSTAPTFGGNLPHLCRNILQRSHIPYHAQATVVGATPGPDGWRLQFKGTSSDVHVTNQDDDDDDDDVYDGLVIATHDASFAARIVQTIVDAERAAAADIINDNSTQQQPLLIADKLQQLAKDLHTVREQGKAPVYTLRAQLRHPADDIPFDAVTIPGSPYVQFLSRSTDADGNGSTWTAVSTTAFAADVLARPDLLDAERAALVTEQLTAEVSKLLAPYCGNNNYNPRTDILHEVSVKRWGAAFSQTSLGAHHDCVALQPWRLSICGDFIRAHTQQHMTPSEAAALSGLEAGERTAAYFSTDDD
eukprot:scaffold7149_cov196-Amphora_coffeaeformis.AAC.2